MEGAGVRFFIHCLSPYWRRNTWQFQLHDTHWFNCLRPQCPPTQEYFEEIPPRFVWTYMARQQQEATGDSISFCNPVAISTL